MKQRLLLLAACVFTALTTGQSQDNDGYQVEIDDMGTTLPGLACSLGSKTRRTARIAPSVSGSKIQDMVLWFEVNQIFVGMIVVSFLLGLAALPFRDAQ